MVEIQSAPSQWPRSKDVSLTELRVGMSWPVSTIWSPPSGGPLTVSSATALTCRDQLTAGCGLGAGSFELPIAAQQMARSGYRVLITLGLNAGTRLISMWWWRRPARYQRWLHTSVPVIFGVLTTDTMQQALERAGIKSNLGWSYGLEALEMGSLMKALP